MRFTLIEILIGLIFVLNIVSGGLSVLTTEDSTDISAPRTDEVKSDWK